MLKNKLNFLYIFPSIIPKAKLTLQKIEGVLVRFINFTYNNEIVEINS